MLFALYYPRREVNFFFIPMPMWMVVAIDLVIPMLPLVGINIGMGNVAVEAHLAGMGYAVVFKQLDLRWSRLMSGRVVPAQTPDLLAGRLRPGQAAHPESRPHDVQRRRRRQGSVGLRAARGAARRPPR